MPTNYVCRVRVRQLQQRQRQPHINLRLLLMSQHPLQLPSQHQPQPFQLLLLLRMHPKLPHCILLLRQHRPLLLVGTPHQRQEQWRKHLVFLKIMLDRLEKPHSVRLFFLSFYIQNFLLTLTNNRSGQQEMAFGVQDTRPVCTNQRGLEFCARTVRSTNSSGVSCPRETRTSHNHG